MKTSINRVLTTHTGSLPRPRDLLQPLHARDSGELYDAAALERQTVAENDAVLRKHIARQTRDSLDFPAVYEEMRKMFGARRALTGQPEDAVSLVCTGPIKYVGQQQVKADIDYLKAAIAGRKVEDAFVTAISPTNL